jgi:hypothetical protein
MLMLKLLCRFLNNIRALLVLACVVTAAHAQQQAGVVSGRVVLDGKASTSVEVVLLTDGNERRTEIARTSTDVEGCFRLNVEEAGRYRVMPIAPAYVSSNEQSVAKVITVAPGEEIKDVDFTLVPGGVITGHVSMPDGRPAIAERVAVTPVAQPGQDRPTLNLPNGILETDDRGVYRVFGLPPGRYLVSAGTGGESVAADAYNRRFAYPRTFHPSVVEEAKATVVEVATGGETTNVDITLSRRAESFSASGRIVEARNSQPLAGVTFGYAASRENGRMSGAPVRDLQTDAEGKFVIPKLTPGRYVVFVSSNRDTNVYSEMLPFEVTNGDVTGLELTAEQGSSVSGTVVVEGATEPNILNKLTGVSLANILYQPEMIWTAREMPVISPDGTFRFNGLRPGKLKIVDNAPRLPRGFSILRVERDGIAQRDGIDIAGDTNITNVRIVMAYGNGIVRGNVTVKSDTVPSGTPLFVFARRADSPSITASTQTDARGSFILEWLAPGEYELTVGVREQGGVRLSAARKTVRVSNNATADASLIFESTNE